MPRHRRAPTPIGPSPGSSTRTGARRAEPVRGETPTTPMTDSPDPLGKRALFWAPAERDEGGPRRSAERDAPGRHALFSDEARASATQVRPVVTLERVVTAPHHDRRFGAGRGLLSPIAVD